MTEDREETEQQRTAERISAKRYEALRMLGGASETRDDKLADLEMASEPVSVGKHLVEALERQRSTE